MCTLRLGLLVEEAVIDWVETEYSRCFDGFFVHENRGIEEVKVSTCVR